MCGFRDLTYGERLRKLNRESLDERRLKAELALVYCSLHEKCAVQFSQLFVTAKSCTRGHSFKLRKPHCNINCRLFSFGCRVIDACNYLPDYVVSASSVQSFKHLFNSVNFSKFLTAYD